MKNAYYFLNDDVVAVCVGNENNIHNSFVIDAEDLDKIDNFTQNFWSYYNRKNNPGILCKNGSREFKLSRLLMNVIDKKERGKFVKHVNGNIFDLRKKNLVLVPNRKNDLEEENDFIECLVPMKELITLYLEKESVKENEKEILEASLESQKSTTVTIDNIETFRKMSITIGSTNLVSEPLMDSEIEKVNELFKILNTKFLVKS
ncbi:hypothetical protein [Bacillus massiliigorillae]|uniref:hypothetical protein n=1 Tax=Bacillus massiliigorillae TaxID=1243664 RepID=UPI00039DA1B2|nr:hypothetical protein [Bacillus massiliigorillae]